MLAIFVLPSVTDFLVFLSAFYTRSEKPLSPPVPWRDLCLIASHSIWPSVQEVNSGDNEVKAMTAAYHFCSSVCSGLEQHLQGDLGSIFCSSVYSSTCR